MRRSLPWCLVVLVVATLAAMLVGFDGDDPSGAGASTGLSVAATVTATPSDDPQTALQPRFHSFAPGLRGVRSAATPRPRGHGVTLDALRHRRGHQARHTVVVGHSRGGDDSVVSFPPVHIRARRAYWRHSDRPDVYWHHMASQRRQGPYGGGAAGFEQARRGDWRSSRATHPTQPLAETELGAPLVGDVASAAQLAQQRLLAAASGSAPATAAVTHHAATHHASGADAAGDPADDDPADDDPADEDKASDGDGSDGEALLALLAELEAQRAPTLPVAQHDRTAAAGGSVSVSVVHERRDAGTARLAGEATAHRACFAALVEALREAAVALGSGVVAPATQPDTGDTNDVDDADEADLTA